MSDTITIYCLVHGEPTANAFPVEIDKNKTIGILKDKIKEKKAVYFADVDADKLTLWRVDIPVGDGDGIPQLVPEDKSKNTKMLPTSKIEKFFRTAPADDYVHVIVELPIAQVAQAPAQAHDRPVLQPGNEPLHKRPRLEEDVFITSLIGWLLTPWSKRPKLLTPVPISQEIKTNGNVGIYAGRSVSIGADDFEKIVTKGYSYVDKTLIISDFLESSTPVSLVVRPRRFGKTTNLTMMKSFFAYPIEPDSKKHREELFRNSKIWYEKRELFEEHFCKYPVIFINLKDFRSCTTWELMQEKLRVLMAKLYEEHLYLLDILSQPQKEYFNRIRHQLHLSSSTLEILSWYLKKYYNRECIVLIDEYDHPLDVASEHGYYNHACDYFSSLLGGLLKSNDQNVEKALLVGVTRVAKAGYLSDFNNVKVYPMSNRLFADRFGFTEGEVRILLRHHKHSESDIEQVKEWYDGYTAGNDISLYNPWSIVSFINENHLDAFWVGTASTRMIQKLIWYSETSFKLNAAKLLSGGFIEVHIRDNLVYRDLFRRADDALWTLLYYSGYLSHVHVDVVSTSSTVADNAPTKLRIPNIEVTKQWLDWLKVPSAPPLNDVVKKLLDGKLGDFHNLLAMTVIRDLSFNDVGGSNAGKRSETFYHGYLLGWLGHARHTGCKVKSNQEGGLGRFDALIEFPEARQAAILEYKVTKRNQKKSIETNAKDALSQLEAKQYHQAVSEEIDQLTEVGIAFQGKQVVVIGKVYGKSDGKWVLQTKYEGTVLGGHENGDDEDVVSGGDVVSEDDVSEDEDVSEDV